MEYNFKEDLKSIREILGLTQSQIAEKIGVEQITISRNEMGKTTPSDKLLERVYEFAFKNNIKLNRLKSRTNNDLGQGFYTGERYEQAISFISGFEKSSVYIFDFKEEGLKGKKYNVNQEWMMTIAYYRGALEEYENHPIIKKLIEKSCDCDYIIAPIADNRMFQIINSFIMGEITDEQCKHCLAATNLGYQYVFKSDKAIKSLKMLERCYISEKEKEYYKKMRNSDAKLGDDKVKLARIKYRGKGRYIDEILK